MPLFVARDPAIPYSMQTKRILTVTAFYPVEADALFAQAVNIDAMISASRGVATYHGLPEGAFEEGKSYQTYTVLRGWLHDPQARITVHRLDPAFRVLQTREEGRMIRHWDHRVTVDPAPEGALWTDQITLDCGLLTGVAARLARGLHRHRHKMRRARQIETAITTSSP